jgi:tRNA-2-methylthio-N6-dimethylallyladenosine synthase
MSGRARDNRLVHFTPAGQTPRPGDVITAVVTGAAPHYLLADAGPASVRRTRGGDAWQARREGQGERAAAEDTATGAAGSPVLLGMPARRVAQ